MSSSSHITEYIPWEDESRGHNSFNPFGMEYHSHSRSLVPVRGQAQMVRSGSATHSVHLPYHNSRPSPNHQRWRLLSLDGGGIKGLAELLILEQIMAEVAMCERRLREGDVDRHPPPYRYFDLIGGTSTGGLIAILLGRMRMNVPEAIHYFKIILKRAYENPVSRKSGRGFLGRILGGPCYKTDDLEGAVREMLRKLPGCNNPDAMLMDNTSNPCKAFVCATSAVTSSGILLRSYKAPSEGGRNYPVRICEAVVGTSLAPVLFGKYRIEHIKTGKDTRQLAIEQSKSARAQEYHDQSQIDKHEDDTPLTLVDGSMALNNPIHEVVREASLLDERRGYASVVSIGSGIIDVTAIKNTKQKHVVSICAEMDLNCDIVAANFAGSHLGRQLYRSGSYFRFDVFRRLDAVDVTCTDIGKDTIEPVMRYVELYVARPEVAAQIKECAWSLLADKYYRPR